MGSVPIALPSRGAALQVSTDGVTWTAVAQLRTITPSGKRTEIVDQTNLLTRGNFKAKLAVQVDSGGVSYDGVLNPNDAGVNLLSSLQDALTPATFRIVLPVPSPPTPSAITSALRMGGLATLQFDGLPPSWLTAGIYIAVNVSDPSFNAPQVLVESIGIVAAGPSTQVSYSNPGVDLGGWEDLTGTIQQMWVPTRFTFQGYVAEHLPAKLDVRKLVAFSGRIEITGAVVPTLGTPWPSPGTEEGPTLNFTLYAISAPVPAGAMVGVKANGGDGGIVLTLDGQENELLYVVDIGPGLGPVTLVDSAGGLIAGATEYELTQINQSVVLAYSGGQWWKFGDTLV